MKLIIAGSRTFTDYEYMNKILDEFKTMYSIEEVVCGMANGADLLGNTWAKENNIPIKEFPANWNEYGKKAGFIRNIEMAKYGTCLIVFWDGISPGTKHMINIAKKLKLITYVFNYSQLKTGVNDEF